MTPLRRLLAYWLIVGWVLYAWSGVEPERAPLGRPITSMEPLSPYVPAPVVDNWLPAR